MTSVIILDKEKTISASNKKILVYDGKKIIKSTPVFIVEDIIIHIDNNIKGNLLKICSKYKIPTHFISKNLKYYGTFMIANSKNILLREVQYSKRLNSEFSLNISKKFIIGKRNSQLWVLKSLDKSSDLPNIKIDDIKDKNQLLGIEGFIALKYWEQFSYLIKNKEFTFKSRTKNPPYDEVNSILSYGYVLLLSKIITNINLVGLDPYFGFYHEINYRRPSLALDLMEEFRPLAVDKLILNLLNKKIIKKEYFENYHGIFILKRNKQYFFVKKWMDWWFNKKFYVKSLKNSYTLSELSLRQIRNFAKYLVGDINEYEPLNFIGSI
ncbi:MAG: CRISPR-associated endonuclease Cas1 [Patescibacteria group bacterium]|nr:CRISPR-associated endonuclease Cas1 [Patescibacteria group bacterium]